MIDIAQYHRNSSDHRPRTQAKLLFNDHGLFVHFRVEDRFVRSLQRKHQSVVAADSCVEFFFKPRHESGHFNIETNCGGTMFFRYHGQDSQRVIPLEDIQRMRIFHTMPKVVDPEITNQVKWRLSYFIPFNLLARYLEVEDVIGAVPWRANLYKGAEINSHPHWGAWQNIGHELNFGQLDTFAPIEFER